MLMVMRKAVTINVSMREIDMIKEAMDMATLEIFKYKDEQAQNKESHKPNRYKRGKLWLIYDEPTQEEFLRYKTDFNEFFNSTKSARFNTDRDDKEIRLIEKDWRILLIVLKNYLTNGEYLRIMGKNEIENETLIYKHTIEKFIEVIKEAGMVMKSHRVKEINYI